MTGVLERLGAYIAARVRAEAAWRAVFVARAALSAAQQASSAAEQEEGRQRVAFEEELHAADDATLGLVVQALEQRRTGGKS